MSIDLLYFILNRLPWVVIGLFFVVILSIYLRDRWNKTLVLDNSKEEEALKKLLDEGKISSSEYQDLSSSCDTLPEVKELAPVPSIYLRLLVIGGKIFSVLLFISSLAILVALLFALNSAFNNIVRFNILVISVAILLSIVLFFALDRLLKGSINAKTLVVYLLFLSMFLPIDIFGIRPLSAILAGYATFALYGKNLKKAYSYIICSVYILLLLLFGYGVSLKATKNSKMIMSYNQTTTGSMSTGTYGRIAQIEKIYFVVGSSDSDSKAIAEKMAKMLTKKIDIPCEVVPFGSEKLTFDSTRDLVFIVSKIYGKKNYERSTVLYDADNKKIEMNDNSPLSNFTGRFKVDMVKQAIHEAIFSDTPTFTLTSVSSGHGVSENYIINSSIDGIQYANCNVTTTDIAEGFVSLLAKNNSTFLNKDMYISVPKFVWQENSSPKLDIPLKSWRVVSESQTIRTYSFVNNDPENKKSVLLRELDNLGYKKSQFSYNDGEILMQLGDNWREGVRIIGISDENSQSVRPKFTPPYCYVIQYNFNNRIENEELIKALDNGSVEFFILSGSLSILATQEERIAAYKRFAEATKNQLNLRLLGISKAINHITSSEFWQKELTELCQAISHIEDAEELHNIFTELQYVIENSDQNADIIIENLPEKIDVLELNTESTEEHCFTLPVESFDNSAHIIYFKFKDDKYQPLQLVATVQKQPSGDYITRMSNLSATDSKIDTYLVNNYDVFRNTNRLMACSSSVSSMSDMNKPDCSNSTSVLSILTYYDQDKGVLNIKAKFNHK